MKNLLLVLFILIIIGLYCKNNMENFTDEEINNIIDKKINNTIKNQIQNYISNIINSFTDDKMKEIKESCKQGEQGPPGPVGSLSSVYQGLYNLSNTSALISPTNESDFNTSKPSSKNSIQLKLNQDKFELRNIDRWQYTDKNTLVNAYNSSDDSKNMSINDEFGICYKGNDVSICSFKNLSNEYDNTLFYDQKTQQFITSDKNKCMELSNDNGLQSLVINKCNDNKNQKFYLH